MNIGVELILKPFLLTVGIGAVVIGLYLGLEWLRRRLTSR